MTPDRFAADQRSNAAAHSVHPRSAASGSTGAAEGVDAPASGCKLHQREESERQYVGGWYFVITRPTRCYLHVGAQR